MGATLLRRLLSMVPSFLGITLVTFALAHLAPGDPGPAEVSTAPLPAQPRELRPPADRSERALLAQYVDWLGGVVRLDFGRSRRDQRPVSEKLKEALPRTVLVSGLAFVFSFAAAIPLGVWSALRRRSMLERLVSGLVFACYSLPTFWVAMLLLMFLARPQALDWFPFQGLTSEGFSSLALGSQVGDLAWHLVLPVTCLSLPLVALVSRHVRSATTQVLAQDYVRTARAKGLSAWAVLVRHVLPNALLPIITLGGLLLPSLVGGSVVVERVFGIPGMGLLALDAVFERDYPVVMGAATVGALVALVGAALADFGYALADPRIRAEESW